MNFKIKNIAILTIVLIFNIKAQAQCGSIFLSSTDTSFCIPKIVDLTVNNYPAGTTFEWDFGTGYTSGSETFKKLFSTSGVFDVKVRLTFIDGSKCVLDYLQFLNARNNPEPSFLSSKLILCNLGDSVFLTDNTPKSMRRDWLIDNNSLANAPRIVMQKLALPYGYKSLTLFVRDSFGCSGKKTFDSALLLPQPVQLSFNANKTSGCVPTPINFQNTSQVFGQTVAWQWLFPGATPNQSVLLSPQNIRYNNVGNYSVRLVSVDNNGCTDTLNKIDYLRLGDSINLNLTLSSNTICANQVLTINHNNQRSSVANLSFTPNTFTFQNNDSLVSRVKFDDIGTYSILLTDNFNGCISEKRINNAVTVNGPVARFNLDYINSCLNPDSIIARNVSLINSGFSIASQWNVYYDSLPNNSLFSSTNSVLRYNASQRTRYTVRLIVNSNNGCRDTLIRRSAFEIRPIRPLFNWIPFAPCPGEMTDFNNQTEQGTLRARNKYAWTFFNPNNSILHKDTQTHPKLSFPNKGIYKIKLRAFNDLGCNDSITLDTFNVIDPTPQFSASTNNVCYKSPIKLKVIYNGSDTLAYSKYTHQWIISHTDSLKTKFVYTGDSIQTSELFPGFYNIKCVRYTKITGACIDTFPLSISLRVSGVTFSLTNNPNEGCPTFTSIYKAAPIYNYNFINNLGKGYNFRWNNIYDTNYVALRSPLNLTTPVVFKKKGYYTFELKSTHISGCRDSVYTNRMKAGYFANFYPQSGTYITCIYKNFQLVNNSESGFKNFKWSILDSTSGFQILPTDTSKNPTLVFEKKGRYRIMLVGFGNGNCNDTIINPVDVSDIRAEFTSTDTVTYCAPVIALLNAKTAFDIRSYQWFLNDVKLNNVNPNIGYLINRNTGPDGIDVKLVVSGVACSDTLEKKDYLKVIGPIPKFSLQNNVGCERLNVKFINESQYYNRFFLEYGDGTALDSINFDRHIYTIFDRALQQQVYYPKLTLIDTFGCLAKYEKDTIIAFKSPQSNFTVDVDSGCALLDVKFTNRTIGAISYQWDFENNGSVDNTGFSPIFQFPAGVFNPKLISKATNNCNDTAHNIVLIKSFANPNVVVTASSDTICYDDRVNFTARMTSNHSNITSWKWDFGNPFLFNDTSSAQNTAYNFKRVLNNLVTLNVIDNYGCKDTIERFIHVLDTLGPNSEPINFVTVVGNKDVEVQWTKSSFYRFNKYRLFRDNSGLFPQYVTSNRQDTTHKIKTGLDVMQSRYCYTIRTEDLCNYIGKPAFSHCTILLQVDDSINKLELNWLTYNGWGANMVDKYLIYRNENNGAFKLIDSTDNNYYTDKDLCQKIYCYYVVAKQRGGRWTSQSNTVCKTPIYIKPTLPVNSVRTTVLSNGKTYTQWLPYQSVRIVKKYHISRVYSGGSYSKYYAESDSLGFIDDNSDVLTDYFSYNYKIRAEDHCKEESPESQSNKTILLDGKSINYVASLEWTPYLKWPSGIKNYQILFRDNNQYKVIATLDSSKKVYEYDFVDTEMDDSLCFRIKATKDTSILVESFSNIVCLVSDPQMFVPSAFTPNKDGHNEVFLPRSLLIFNNTGNPILDFKMEIFNRWGEKVFESNNSKVGWDGTFMGENCQEGTYIYHIRGLGLDGKSSFNFKGVVTLLR